MLNWEEFRNSQQEIIHPTGQVARNSVSIRSIDMGLDWQKSDDGQQFTREIPCAIFRGIEDFSHWLQQDAPEEFVSALLELFSN